MIDAQLLRWVDRDKCERLLWRESAVTHCLRGFHVHATRKFIGIRIEAHNDTCTMHDRAVPRNRIHHFDFVCPPVAEARRTGTMCCDLRGNFVALKNVLQRCDAETKLLRRCEQHEDFVLTVTVAVNESRSFDDLSKCFEFEILAWRQRARARSLVERGVRSMFRAVGACGFERIVYKRGNTHARTWIARLRAHDVFTKRKLDARWRAFEAEFLGVFAPTNLHHGIASTNGIRGAVELIDRGESASKLAIPLDVVRIDDVTNRDFRGVRVCAFVDATGNAGVAVTINEAGRDVHAAHVEDGRAIGRVEFLTDRRDFPIANEHVCGLQRARGALRPNRGVAEEHRAAERLRGEPEFAERERKYVLPERRLVVLLHVIFLRIVLLRVGACSVVVLDVVLLCVVLLLLVLLRVVFLAFAAIF